MLPEGLSMRLGTPLQGKSFREAVCPRLWTPQEYSVMIIDNATNVLPLII